MKFGQNLHRYQVVEWTPFYIDYKGLKKLYRLATKVAVERGEDADFTEFTAVLEQNLFKAKSFHQTRYAIIQQRMNVLHNHYGITDSTALNHVNGLELEELTEAFLELRDALKQLQWYGLVNFNKIVGRLGKFEGIILPPETHSLRIPNIHLTIGSKILEELRYVDDGLSRLQSRMQEARRDLLKPPSLRRKYYDEPLQSQPLINASSAIDQGDALMLDQILEHSRKNPDPDQPNQQRLLFALLHFSTLNGSKKCINILLPRIESLQEFGDHLHWLVITIGSRKKSRDRQIRVQSTPGTTVLSMAIEGAVDQLVHVIRQLGLMLRAVLYEKDVFGRLPLHHAVQYGLFEICQEILEYMKGHEGDDPSFDPRPALLPDSEGLSALNIAVLTRNAVITELLLNSLSHSPVAGTRTNISHAHILPGKLLTTAIKMDSFTTIQLLHTSMIDVNYRDHNDETALYLAVRSGRQEYVNMLLEVPQRNDKVDLDAPDVVYGWTPLILACVKGDLAMMELLLRAGADPTVRDIFGSTAKDHAAFRGHLPMAKTLMALDVGRTKEGLRRNNFHQVEQRIRKASRSFEYPKDFGQEVPPHCSQIYINLGPLDTYKPITAVNLSPYVYPDIYNPQREADFQVEIRAIGGDQSSHVVQLPILEDMANKPWRFLTENTRDFKLTFNIFPAEITGQERGPLIGSAVALLESLKQGLGSQRESLIRDFTIPILQTNTLEFIGTVTFYFLVITPFPHPRPPPGFEQELGLRRDDSPTLIGHRGIGQNDPSRRQLQIGENTIESFLSAIDLGASYIEFDVQLTKDNTPVIYHDFLMSETGIDAPLHNISLEQFIYISEAQSSFADLPSMAEERYLERCRDQLGAGYRPRSHSLNVYEMSRARSLVDRMKHTFEFKLNESKGFDSYKGNVRSEYIQASFMTLEELFVKLPESVRFDIEIKYPMLFEAHDWGMDTYAVELNHLVDTILEKVYRLAGNRIIFFSSFSPEICILLSNKQHSYPVFFLSESGHIPSADARADSLQEAIHFAKSWDLPGVISRSEPLVMSPDLVRYVKDSGLLCISWGGLNDDPEHAKTQANAGLDAIIVNSVNLIAKTLSDR